MSQYYYKNKLEGKELFTYSCNEPQDNENFIEITEEEYKEILNAYEHQRRINSQLPFDKVEKETGFIKHSDMSKVWFYINHNHRRFNPNDDIEDFKIKLFINELKKGTVFPPVEGYYLSLIHI